MDKTPQTDDAKIGDLIETALQAANSGDDKRARALLKEALVLVHAYIPGDRSDYFLFNNWRNAMNAVHRTISRVSGGGLIQETWFMGNAAAKQQEQ